MDVPSPEAKALTAALSAPFEPHDVKWKPSLVKGNRCLAMAYVSARTVMDRLDEVLGVANWQDEYTPLPSGSMLCRLQLRIGGEWITKMDVGSPSEQPDEGDREKASVSDALKRAAVKFGIARYLYRLAAQWVDYDPVKKQMVHTPELPAFARPKQQPAARPAPAAARQTAPPAADPQTREERAAIEAEGGDPAVRDNEAFARLCKATGTRWVDAVEWVNSHLIGADGDPYKLGIKLSDLSPEHRRALVAGLRRKPGGREA